MGWGEEDLAVNEFPATHIDIGPWKNSIDKKRGATVLQDKGHPQVTSGPEGNFNNWAL